MQEPKRSLKVLFAIVIAEKIPGSEGFYDDRGTKMLIWVQEGSKQAILVSEKKIYSEKNVHIYNLSFEARCSLSSVKFQTWENGWEGNNTERKNKAASEQEDEEEDEFWREERTKD